MKWVMAIAASLQAAGFCYLLLRAKQARRIDRIESSPRIEALAESVAAAQHSGADQEHNAATRLHGSSESLSRSPLAQLLQTSPSASHVRALLGNESRLVLILFFALQFSTF